VIVRRDGAQWIVIRQMDHASHCGELERAWSDGPLGGPGSVSPSLEYAAAFHDLGWTEIDRTIELDADGTPMNFAQIDERRHAEFYAAAVRTIAKTDPYAGYLVSLHATGLYSGRFGWAGFRPVDWTAIGPHGRALLEGEKRYRAELARSIPPQQLEFDNAWRDYMLLETFDYLSLLTCFGLESEGSGPVPTSPGQWYNPKVRRIGPFEVEISPFPFAAPLEIPAQAARWSPGGSPEVPVTVQTAYRQARFSWAARSRRRRRRDRALRSRSTAPSTDPDPSTRSSDPLTYERSIAAMTRRFASVTDSNAPSSFSAAAATMVPAHVR
jgi:uncharacterized protein DUF3891